MSKSQVKAMLITYFEIKSIVHFQFIPNARQSTKLIMWKC